MELVKIWAHRGASGYAPENTLEAFELALKQGADGIELDVHLSKDGELIVAHDEKINRVSNGTGYIKDMTLSELKTYRFNQLHPEYQKAKVPTLQEVFDLIKFTRLTVNIELKTNLFTYEGIEQKLLDAVCLAGMEQRVIYSSFNHYSLLNLRKLNPDVKIGLLYSDGWIDTPAYAHQIGANALHPYFQATKVPCFMEDCKKYQLEVNTWTVNKPQDMKDMIEKKVNAIITNYPDKAFELLHP